jgi:hypothetical protein
MKRHLSILALGLGAFLLCACQDDSPIVSAEVQGPTGGPRPLSVRQVGMLNTWLTEHRSGWSPLVLATPPTGSLSVTVNRSNGASGRLEFYSQEGWKTSLMYWAKDPSDNLQGVFGAEQVSSLRQELEKSQ